jgi:hypothetical protein
VVDHVLLAACEAVVSLLNEDFKEGGRTSRINLKERDNKHTTAQRRELGVAEVVEHGLLAACDTFFNVLEMMNRKIT